MLQAEKQDAEQRSKQRRWPKGVSGNPRGRESKATRRARCEGIIAAWAEPFGGITTLKPAELDLLRQAAELSLMRPRTVEDQGRVANTISKILAQVGFADKRRRREWAETAAPTFADIASQAQADAARRRAQELAADATQGAAPPERESEVDEIVHTMLEGADDDDDEDAP